MPNTNPWQVLRVIDCPMGGFKTTTAISRMNGSASARWLYVAPLLSETKRIVDGCPTAYFTEPTQVYNPETKKVGTKSEALMTMLLMGMNVAISHSLYLRMTPAMLKVCRDQGYSLMLDETPEMVSPVNTTAEARELLFSTHQLAKGMALNAQRTVCMVTEGSEGSTGYNLNSRIDGASVRRMVALARSGKLQLVHDAGFVKVQPPELISSFKEANVLTFMFQGSMFQRWLEINKMPHAVCSISGGGDDPKIDMFTPEHEWAFKCKTSALLAVNDHPGLNRIGGKRSHLKKGESSPLTSTWWDDTKANVLEKEAEIKAKIATFFRDHTLEGTKAEHNMWTCLKAHRKALVGNGHAMKAWLPANARATNSWKDKANLCFMINVYPQLPLEFYFREMGKPVDKDAYAVSQLLQWVFRSRIRMDQPVTLYLPAQRMRNLLNDYLHLGPTAVPYTPQASDTNIKQAA